MAKLSRIEAQDQFGNWRRFHKVSCIDTSIKLALQRTLKTQLASKSRETSALDDKIGMRADILQG